MVAVPAYGQTAQDTQERRRPYMRQQPLHRPSQTRRHFVRWRPGCLQDGSDEDNDDAAACERQAGSRGRSPIDGMCTLPIVPPSLRTPVLTRMAVRGDGADSDGSEGEREGEDPDDVTRGVQRVPRVSEEGSGHGAQRRRRADVKGIAVAAGIGIAVAAVCTVVIACVV